MCSGCLVRVCWQSNTAQSGAGKLSGMALKFPHIRKAFKNVKTVFDKMTDGKQGVVTADKLGAMLAELGAGDLPKEEIEKLFDRSDLDESKEISWKEFLIAVAEGYYLKDNAEAKVANDPNYEENRKGFKIVQDAFNSIDIDKGGSVDREELKKAMFASASGKQSQEIMDARFAELDFNSDGDVSFPEFLYGYINWVGMVCCLLRMLFVWRGGETGSPSRFPALLHMLCCLSFLLGYAPS